MHTHNGINHGRVAFNAPLPRPEDLYVPLLSARPGCPVRGRVVSRRPVSVLVHWVCPTGVQSEGRTLPHVGPDGMCPHCTLGNQVPRWQAYLGIWLEERARYAMLQVTKAAADRLPCLRPESDVVLRGRLAVAKRVGSHRNSPVAIELSSEIQHEDLVPAPVDVTAALLRLWGLGNTRGWYVNGEYVE